MGGGVEAEQKLEFTSRKWPLRKRVRTEKEDDSGALNPIAMAEFEAMNHKDFNP
jgi:hypothetical protein